jgi:hypothetical protein
VEGIAKERKLKENISKTNCERCKMTSRTSPGSSPSRSLQHQDLQLEVDRLAGQIIVKRRGDREMDMKVIQLIRSLSSLPLPVPFLSHRLSSLPITPLRSLNQSAASIREAKW